MSGEKYIGLDVHQATISVALVDSQGKAVIESMPRREVWTAIARACIPAALRWPRRKHGGRTSTEAEALNAAVVAAIRHPPEARPLS